MCLSVVSSRAGGGGGGGGGGHRMCAHPLSPSHVPHTPTPCAHTSVHTQISNDSETHYFCQGWIQRAPLCTLDAWFNTKIVSCGSKTSGRNECGKKCNNIKASQCNCWLDTDLCFLFLFRNVEVISHSCGQYNR